MGIVSTLAFFAAVAAGGGPDAIFTPGTPLFSLIWGVWTASSGCWVIMLLAVGMRYLNYRNKWLEYGQEAILPIYLLHQPLIIAISFLVVQWDTSAKLGAGADILVKLPVVVLSSFVVTLGLYEFVIRRLKLFRALFGMKPRRT